MHQFLKAINVTKRTAALTAAAAVSTMTALTAPAAATDVEFKRGYADSRYGQTHYYVAQPEDGKVDHTPLVFFHQTATSGQEFKPLVLNMAKDRLVFAMDTPGYGMSDRPENPPSMSELALSMADALENLGYGADGAGPVDVFGFHTGVFIAAELSLHRPDLVRKVVMSGVGYFTPEGREERFNKLPRDKKISETGEDVMKVWDYSVNRRDKRVSFERAYEQFLAMVPSAGKGWYAYHGVWSYPIEERFALLNQENILILQADEYLLEHSRRAKRELLKDTDMIEMMDVTGAIFDTGSDEFAKNMRAWLD